MKPSFKSSAESALTLMLVAMGLAGPDALRTLAGDEFRLIPPAAEVGPRTEPVALDAYHKVLYVSASAAGRSEDGSQERPFGTLQRALASIQDASPTRRYALLVAEGRYAVVELALKEYVDLYGGFGPEWRRSVLLARTGWSARADAA